MIRLRQLNLDLFGGFAGVLSMYGRKRQERGGEEGKDAFHGSSSGRSVSPVRRMQTK